MGEKPKAHQEGSADDVGHGPPRPRRRPPRERWILNRDDPPQQEEPIQPQILQQVQRVQDAEERHLTGSGRLTRPPNFYGVEKGRDEIGGIPDMNISFSSTTREVPPATSPTPGPSCSPTPPGSFASTPMSTPATSPDTSAIAMPQDLSWQLPPMECNLTAAERADDPIQRHRHWSIVGEGVYPDHPRFLGWYGQLHLGPRTRRSSAGF